MTAIELRQGNMFTIAEEDDLKEYALAHCISRDCVMGKGIAVEFKKRFGGVEDLKKQVAVENAKGAGHGCLLTLTRKEREICYLVTKKTYRLKPTYKSLTESLEALRAHLTKEQVAGVVMPKIGCGLDRLEWSKVASILDKIFKPTDIKLVVCSL